MKIHVPETYSVNYSEFKLSEGPASVIPFKTVLSDVDSAKCKVNSAENNDIAGHADNDKAAALCGIDPNLVSHDTASKNDAEAQIIEENKGGISSCYECEVREDCQRFKKDKTDILVNMNISLKTKYDPFSGKNIPLFTPPITENENSVYSSPFFLQSFYLASEHKKQRKIQENDSIAEANTLLTF